MTAAMGGLAISPAAIAGTMGDKEARFASGTGNTLFLAIGTALPLMIDGKEGKDHALRALDTLIVSNMLSEGLKTVSHVRRPDGSDYKSFPSGHATTAFAIATIESEFHPKQAPLWYLGAAVIAGSRVELNRHHPVDVIAGAILGCYTAKLELSSRHGLLLFPFIDSDKGCVGVQVTKEF